MIPKSLGKKNKRFKTKKKHLIIQKKKVYEKTDTLKKQKTEKVFQKRILTP